MKPRRRRTDPIREPARDPDCARDGALPADRAPSVPGFTETEWGGSRNVSMGTS